MHGHRVSVHIIHEMWRITHEWLASIQMLLTSLTSQLNYRNYPSYLLQNSRVVIKTRIYVYNTHTSNIGSKW